MGVIRINKFEAAKGKVDEVYEFLNSLLPYVSSCSGCLSCEILKNTEVGEEFVLLERWQSIEHHLRSIEAFPKDRIEAAAELFASMPVGAYYSV